MPLLLEIDGFASLSSNNIAHVSAPVHVHALWSMATTQNIELYKQTLDCDLHCCDLPVDAVLCRDFNCDNDEYRLAMKLFLICCCWFN